MSTLFDTPVVPADPENHSGLTSSFGSMAEYAVPLGPPRPVWWNDARTGRVTGGLCHGCAMAVPFPRGRHGVTRALARPAHCTACADCGRPYPVAAVSPLPNEEKGR